MKIFCIGRNYAEHAREMGSEVPSAPVVFMKPPTALLIRNRPFYFPDFSNEIHYEGELVLRICKNGKSIQPEFASSYYDAIGFGIDFTARDLQSACKKKGHPWEIAKGFDHSAAVGSFVPKDQLGSGPVEFSLKKNGETVQKGTTADLLFSFDEVICYLSRFFKLQLGDYIFTGTPEGVGPVAQGDKLEGFIAGERMLKCEIK